jgi:predicted Zn-dependent protease
LQACVRSDTFRAALLPARLDKSKEAIPAEPASGFDVELVLADLMNRPGEEKEAEERLEKLANDNAGRPEPWARLAYLAWRQERTEEARQNFDKAYSLGDRKPRLLWDYGRLVEGANPQRAQEVLGVLAEQAPDRVDG